MADAGRAETEAVVQSILIEGAVNVKPADISAALKTRIGAVLTRETLREDVKEVWRMDRFDDVSADVTSVDGGVRVTLVVRERPVIHEVRFVGIKELGDKELKDKFPVKEGDYYDPARGKEGADRIVDALREKGYPDATAKADPVPAGKERGKMDLVVTANEGLKMHVRKIAFKGIKAFPEGSLKKTLKNKEAAFLFQSGLYLADELENDRGRLQQFYKNEGYQKARVTDVEVTRTGKGKEDPGEKPKLDQVTLTFTVEEGIQYSVRSLSLAGMTLFRETELRAKIDLETGAKLSQKRLDEGLAAIREMYTTRGYIYAQIEPAFTFDEAKGEADVAITIREGTVAVIDRILLRGNEETKDKIIMREMEIKEGEEFNTEKIRRSQENVYNLGFFEDVRIYTEPSLKTGRENLVFDVKERQTGTISLGGGYSSQFGFVGFLQLTKANLFGLGIRVSAEWEIGQKRRNVQLDYFDPYFLDSKISLGLGFWDTDRDLPNTFKQRSTGGSVEFGYRFPSKRWRASLSYKYEINDVDQLGNTALPSGVSDKPQATSSPGLTLTYENRDNIFDPMKGWAHRWSAQVAGGPIPSAGMKFLGGDTSFYKVTYDGSMFQPLVKVGIRPSLALHTRLGRGWGFDGRDVPIFERFFLGGTDSIRGYSERELGPKDPVTGTPVGGRAMAQFNAEIKWPLVPRVLTLAAPFYDVGYAWTSFPFTTENIKTQANNLATSVGLGVRLTIPGTIIVIRLDYGWGQTKAYGPPDHGKLHFNIGNIF